MSNDNDNYWSEIARLYERMMPRYPFYNELRQKIIAVMKPASHILDCGCGTGIIALDLLQDGHTVLGIDNSPQMLNLALEKRSTLPPEQQVDINFKLGDSEQLVSECPDDESFDGIVCNNVLFNVESPTGLLQQLHRLTKSGGLVSISGPIPDASVETLHQKVLEDFKERGIYEKNATDVQTFFEFHLKLREVGHKNTYTVDQLSQILTEDIGFSQVVQSDQDTYEGQSYFVVVQK